MKDIVKVMQFLLNKGNANFRCVCMKYLKDHSVLDSPPITINNLKNTKGETND